MNGACAVFGFPFPFLRANSQASRTFTESSKATMLSDLMRRVDVVYVATGGGDDKKKEDAELDPFRRTKKDLHEKLKAVREHLKERDDLLESEPTSTNTIIKSQTIRRELKDARDTANEMREFLQKDQAKKSKKLPPDEIAKREEQLQLVWKHIEECERLEKRRYQPRQQPNTQQRTDLFSTAQRSKVDKANKPGVTPAATSSSGASSSNRAPDYAPPTETDLPPFEVEQHMQEFKQRNEKLDQGVEEIGKGVTRLKNMANAIGTEIEVQNKMLDELEIKVDNTNLQLLNVNRKLKDTLKKVKGADRFIMNLILLLIVLGIAAYVYNMMRKK